MNLKGLLPGRREVLRDAMLILKDKSMCKVWGKFLRQTDLSSLSVSWLRRPIWTNDDGPMLTPAISWFKPEAELGERTVRFSPWKFLLRSNFKPTKPFSTFRTYVRTLVSHISESHVSLTVTSFLTNNNLFYKNISYRSII